MRTQRGTTWSPRLAPAAVLLITLTVVMAGCGGARQPWDGTWRGSVIVLNVEYRFQGTSYNMASYSFNDVMVSGVRGVMTVEGDLMKIREKEQYVFDNDTGKGRWESSTESYDARWSVAGDRMSFQPLTSPITIELTRVP